MGLRGFVGSCLLARTLACYIAGLAWGEETHGRDDATMKLLAYCMLPTDPPSLVRSPN
jgi:hypothetical protein